MKKVSLIGLTILSALFLTIASCGEPETTSNIPATTAELTTVETTTIEETTVETTTDQTTEGTSVEETSWEPFTPSEEEYGVLLGSFRSTSGTLVVEMEGATFTPDGNYDEVQLTPGAYETIKVDGEELKAVVYKEGYRIHLSSGEYKFVIMETLDEGEWLEYDKFMPETGAFGGAFNLWEAGSTDASNVLRIYGNQYDPDLSVLGGYPIHIMQRSTHGRSYDDAVLHTFFTLENGEYVIAADEYTLEDNEYFGYPFTVTDTGLRYVGDTSDTWYPDFSLLCDRAVDENGKNYQYSYEAESGGLVDVDTYQEYGTYNVASDERGFYFTFGDTDPITFRINANEFTFDNGSEEIGYAPAWTFYADLDNTPRTFEGDGKKITVGFDIDWDTWLYNFALSIDDVAIEGAKLIGARNGIAYLQYQIDDTVYYGYRDSEYSLRIQDQKDNVTIYYDSDYLSHYYVGRFATLTQDGYTTVVIDENRKVYIGGAEAVQGTVERNEDFGIIVIKAGEYSFGLLSEDLGIYILIKDDVTTMFINEEKFDALVGSYLGLVKDGSNQALQYQDHEFTYRGVKATASALTLLSSGAGDYTIAFMLACGTSIYYVAPDFAGAINVYTANNGTLSFTESVLLADKYNEIANGRFIYKSEKYGEEIFDLDETTGMINLTTETGENQAEIVSYDKYMFSHDKNGNVIISVYVNSNGRTVPVPFTYVNNTIVSPTGYIYLNENLFYAQGIWTFGEHILVVDGTTVKLDGDAINVATAKAEDGSYTLSNDEYTFSFAVAEEGAITASVKAGETTTAMTKYEFKTEDWVGTYTGDAENTWELKVNEATGKLTCYKNNAFFMDTFDYVLVDGNVCIKYSTPFGSATFSIAGGNKTVTATGSSIPVPPVPPVL